MEEKTATETVSLNLTAETQENNHVFDLFFLPSDHETFSLF
jgi:hypothetical protein